MKHNDITRALLDALLRIIIEQDRKRMEPKQAIDAVEARLEFGQ